MGHFTEDPDEGQLVGSFLLDQTARRRAMAARGARNMIGWAVQLGTVRYLGAFLNNPEEVPGVVVAYVAEQLGLEPATFAGYGSGESRWDHQEQIREGYGYTKFEFDQWFALARWLYQRAWRSSRAASSRPRPRYRARPTRSGAVLSGSVIHVQVRAGILQSGADPDVRAAIGPVMCQGLAHPLLSALTTGPVL
ncbi:DUF4158 domain-containing protein [Streptomyces sp. NPDC056638]|uniref:DUF4158 domain-containing protein n=1 Tax=Streptomyces sp. NPDC056638 TaxID=3345887 RepID=UPI0036CDC53F